MGFKIRKYMGIECDYCHTILLAETTSQAQFLSKIEKLGWTLTSKHGQFCPKCHNREGSDPNWTRHLPKRGYIIVQG